MRFFCATKLDENFQKSHISVVVTDSKPLKLAPGEYWLEFNQDIVLVTTEQNSFLIKSSNFSKWLDLNEPPLIHSSNSANRLQKTIKRFVTTIVDAKLVGSVKNDALITFLGRDDARELERSWRSPHMLPRVVLNLKDFHDYETCQLFVHERGRAIAESWTCTNKKDISFSKTSTNNFNKIFSYIKKSKSKLFDQSQSMLADVYVVGNFLAKEFSFQNHSALIFLSRNGFLPPGEDELKSFNSLATMISPFLDRLLTQEQAGEKLNQLMLLMETIPIPLQVLDNNEVLIFENIAFKTRDESIEYSTRNIELDSGYKLTLHEEKAHSFDIDHHRRVSLLGELLNTLQHELNNPLFGLNLGSLDMSSENEGEVAETFHDISHNSARCQTIIKNFSNLYSHSKSDSSIEIKDFVSEIFILTKSEIRGIKTSISFNGFNSIENFRFKTNPTTLSQVIFNLIINAGQAIKGQVQQDKMKLSDGLIRMDVTKLENSLLFEITDNGPGLKDEFFKNAFKPFYTTKSQGTGLGLTISRGLLESIGSNLITKNNSEEAGAIFSFELPIPSNS